MTRFLRLILFLLPFLMSFATYGQYEEGVLRVKLKDNYVHRIDRKKLKYGQFGLRNVDRFSEGIGASSVNRIFREAGKYEAAHKKFGLHLWYEIRFDKRTTLAAALKGYRNLPEFEIVEGMRRYHAIEPVDEKPGSLSPQSLPGPTNDPQFSTQWHYKNTGQTGGTPGADISLPQAWSIQTGDPDVIVAVIDGGIDLTHPDLAASMWINAGEIPGNGIDDDSNGYIDDVNGYGFGDNIGTIHPHFHGTHVAGTIAAVTNNGIGVSGIAGGSGTGNGVRLMSCAGFGASGTGGFEDAMVYAADNGAVISQNSWGGGSHAIEAAIDYFIARAGFDNSDANFDDNIQIGPVAGGIVIFAAGNSNTDNTSIGYPASYPPVMAVASTDHDDVKSYFSNYGSWVDIAAPGSQVYSTYPVSLGSYAFLSGTSMACPHVSGAAALVISQFGGPSLHPQQVWDRLQFTADDIDDLNPGFEDKLGDGRVNAFNALQVDDDVPPAAITDLSAEESKLTSILLSWTAPGASDDEGVASFYDIRYSTSLITAANFESASQVENPPRPMIAGTEEEYEITGLNHSTQYYFAIKAKDFFGNVSAISNVVSTTTLLPPVIGVSPDSFTQDLFTGSSITRILTVSNTGESDLHIDVSASTFATSSLSANTHNQLLVKQHQLAGIEQKKSTGYPSLIQQSRSVPVSFEHHTIAPQDIPGTASAGRLFSLNHTSGKIVEINPATGAVIKEISPPEVLSGGPDGLAFDGTYLYYINGFGSNSIHRIDAETGELVSSLALGLPGIDALAHSGEFVYAMDYTNGVIFEINFDEAELIRTIDPPVAVAGGISFGGQRGTIFVSNFGEGIYEINLETGAVENTIAPSGTIYGLGYSDVLGILFAANVSTGKADAIDPETGTVLYSLSGVLSAAMASDETGSRWLIPDNTITTVAPGTSEDIPVLLDANGLIGGTYHGKVRINSNDPVTPLVEVPVELIVTGAANISISSAAFEFANTFVHDSTGILAVVKNNGTDVLHVTAFSDDLPPFHFLMDHDLPFELQPGESASLAVGFVPQTTGIFLDTLEIASDDPDMPLLRVPLSGTSLEPPLISLTPDAIHAELLSGFSTSRYINIQNNGEADLTWEISLFASPDPASMSSQENFLRAPSNQTVLNNSGTTVSAAVEGGPFPLAAGDFTAKASSPVSLTCVTTDPVNRIIYAQANLGTSFYKYDPVANSWTTLASSPINSGNNGGAVCLNGKIYTVYTNNSSSIGVYTIATDTWTTIPNGLLVGTANITTDGTYIYLVSGIDFGRYNPVTSQWTSLDHPPFYFERWGGLSYREQTIYGHQGNGYSGFAKYDIASDSWEALSNVPGGTVLGSAIDPSANKYYTYGSYFGTNWYAYDLTANTWSVSTIPLFSVNDGGMAFIGTPGSSGIYFVQGEGATGVGRFETAPAGNWLQVHEISGQVSSGETQEIEVGLIAVDLPGGIYSGTVTVHSNDPLHEEIVVPVTMSVTGVPDIQPNKATLAFGEVYLNTARDTTLVITNVGTDDLEVSSVVTSHPFFTVASTPFSLDPLESKTLTITFLPTAAGSVTADLTLTSNDPDEPSLVITLIGTGVTPPAIVVTPLSVSESLLSGTTTTSILTIQNTGGSVLHWDITTEFPPAPGSTSEPTVFFQPKGDAANGTNNEGVTVSSSLEGGPYPAAPGDFSLKASSSGAMTCVAVDPLTGNIYAQGDASYGFYRYDPPSNTWSTLDSSPIHSGNNGGAVCLNEKIYTVYTGNVSLMGVYNIATNTWSTMTNGLAAGTGNITTDGTYLYLVVGTTLKRYHPVSNTWTTLSPPPFSFEPWGGLSYKDEVIYGHRGNGSTFFAKYNVTTNTWTSLPEVPGGAVRGSAIDPVANKYYTYGSYSGSNWYAYDIANNLWGVSTIPFFAVSDGGLAYSAKNGASGIYFVQGENGSGFAKFETAGGSNWLQLDKISGTVAAGSNDEVTITLNATGLVGGEYTADLHINNNDPVHPEIEVPVTLSVAGVPDIHVDKATLAYGNVYVNTKRDSTITIRNNGTDVLNIASVAINNAKFAVSFSPLSLDPGESHSLTVSFTPTAPGAVTGALTVSSNDPDQSSKIIILNGNGIVPPLAVLPTSLDVVMDPEDWDWRQLKITNTTATSLNWTMSVKGNGVGTIHAVASQLAAHHTSVTSLIPNRYDFFEGETGSSIGDGGGDMYDGGNYLTTNISGDFNYLAYTNGVVAGSSYLGATGDYFTAKYPGLFVLVTADMNIASFKTDGNLGADGSGSIDAAVLTAVHGGKNYKGFIRRVYGAGDPSVNHLIIVEDNGTVSAIHSSSTDSDLHKLENLSGVKRMYYLLFASNSGGYINNAAMQSIMNGFLDIVNSIPTWVHVGGPSSGTLTPGQSDFIDVIFETDDFDEGVYTADIITTTNAPASTPFNIPLKLTVGTGPDIEVDSLELKFKLVSVGSFKEEVITIRNQGTSLLEVSSISSTNSEFVVSADIKDLLPFDDSFDSIAVSVRFVPTSNGPKTGKLRIVSNDPETNILDVDLSGIGISPAFATITPETVSHSIYQDQSKVVTLKLKNTGSEIMHWNLTGLPSWAFVDTQSGSLGAQQEKNIKLTLDAAGLTAGAYSSGLKINYNHPITPVVNLPVAMTVLANHAPIITKVITEKVIEMESEPIKLNLAEHVSDPDNDVLTYSISVANSSLVTTAINGSVASIGPLAIGTTTLTVKAMDAAGASVSISFSVAVIAVRNKAPIVTSDIDDQDILMRSPALNINLAGNFSDPENDLLKFGSLTSEQTVVSTRIVGSVLEITPLNVGEATLTVWAEDRESARAEINFKVKVTPVTGIDPESVDGVLHCYPNPFEDKTMITYEVNMSGQVELTVVDVTGTIRQTLVNEFQTTGRKTFAVDGNTIASGVYFYRLVIAGKQMGIRKMIRK